MNSRRTAGVSRLVDNQTSWLTPAVRYPHALEVYDHAPFCSLRVVDTLKRPVAAGLRRQLQQEPNLNSFRLLLGLGVEDVERAVAVFLAFQPEVEGVALITTVKPYERERLLSLIAPEKQEMKAGTATYYVGKKNPAAVHFLNERTFIVGLGKDVKKFLERPIGKETPGPLSEALLAAADTHTLVFGARPRLLVSIEKKDVPPPYQGYLPLLDAQSATLTLDADQDLRLGLRLAFADEEQAKKGEKAAKEALIFASLVVRQFPAMLEKIPALEFKPLIPKVRGLIEATAAAMVETQPQRKAVVVEHTMRIQSPDWFNIVVQAAPFLAPRPAKPGTAPATPPPVPRKVKAPKTPEEAEAAIQKLGGDVKRDKFTDGKPIISVKLVGKQVTDDDLVLLRPLTTLTELSLIRLQITDKGLVHLKGLKELDRLDLGGNDGITDAGLAHLKGLAKLKTLRLLGTRVSDKGAAEFKKARPDVNVVN